MVLTRQQLLEAANELEKQASATTIKFNKRTYLATAAFLREDADRLPDQPKQEDKHHED